MIAVNNNFNIKYIGSNNPEWASVSNGTFICMDCAINHRILGPFYSTVRSILMDTWSDKQLKSMNVGGNKNLHILF